MAASKPSHPEPCRASRFAGLPWPPAARHLPPVTTSAVPAWTMLVSGKTVVMHFHLTRGPDAGGDLQDSDSRLPALFAGGVHTSGELNPVDQAMLSPMIRPAVAAVYMEVLG